MKRIIAIILAASALIGASQAFAYEQTTVTTTRTVETHHAPVVVRDHGDWRHREWMREQHRRRWMEARRNYERERAYQGD
jgi:hypothetical protein